MRLLWRMALVALAATTVWADDDDGIGKVRVGVPNAVTPTPGVAQPSVIDPDFAVRLLATAEDPLENPSGVITKFGILTTGVRTEPDENTFIKFPQNPAARLRASITAIISSIRVMRTAETSPTSPASISM